MTARFLRLVCCRSTPGTASVRQLTLLTAVFLCVSACHGRERDEARSAAARLHAAALAARETSRSERTTATARRAAAERQILDLTERVRRIETENQQLALPSQHSFDEAAVLEAQATAADTDDADRAAATAFRAFYNRFPEEALAATADRRADALDARIAERASNLRRAQAAVVHLIAQCWRESAAARAIDDHALRWQWWGSLDLDHAMSESRRSAGPTHRATAAKNRAIEMLESVPDPGDVLRGQVDRCDEGPDHG